MNPERLPPAVMVHGAGHVRLAMSLGRPLTLLSAPNAGVFAGAGWWRALVCLAEAANPGLAIADILDCGQAPGRAMEALQLGQQRLVLHAKARIWQDIAARAACQGAIVLAQAPPSLDLARPGAARHLASWLA
jgi:hypothetical protein